MTLTQVAEATMIEAAYDGDQRGDPTPRNAYADWLLDMGRDQRADEVRRGWSLPITLNQAKNLGYVTLYHYRHRNADGTAQRWRVNGKPQTWKRDPGRVRVPLKLGLKRCSQLTEGDFTDNVCWLVSLTDPTETDR